jgi:hypothetical protein
MTSTEVVQCLGNFTICSKNFGKIQQGFFEFLRMSVAIFDHILSRVKHRLQKKSTNFKKPISPEERLYATLR